MEQERNKYKIWINKNSAILILAFVVIFGFSLRTYHLGHPSLWFDEACTYSRVNGDIKHTLGILQVSPIFPPLYYLLVNGWTKAFGHSERALRFPSVIFSTLSIILVYCLCKQLFNEDVGLMAALLLSVSPYAINYAQEAKMYAMLWFLNTLSFLYLIRWNQYGSKKYLVAYIVSSVASIYTQHIGFLILFVQSVVYIGLFRGNRVKQWFIGQAIIILCYLPWAYYTTLKINVGAWIGWIPETPDYWTAFVITLKVISGQLIGTVKGKFCTLEFCLYTLLILIPLAYPLISTFVGKRQVPLRRQNVGMIILWWALPVVAFILIDKLYTPVFYHRYLGYGHIPVVILASLGIFILNRHLRHIKGVILLTLFTLTFVLHLVPYYNYELKINKQNWRGLIQDICRQSADDSLIIVSAYTAGLGQFPPLNYYGSCIKGDVRHVSKYRITEDYRSAFVLYINKKRAVPHINLLNQHGFAQTKEIRNLQEDAGFLLQEDSGLVSFSLVNSGP